MATNMSAAELAQQIEQLVEGFLAGGREAAAAAVERAFASTSSRRVVGAARQGARRPPAPKRSPQEVGALSDRLYEAICANPGAAMVVLAPIVGATPRALNVPATKLKKAGRIRSVGQRHLARYFPMVKTAAKTG